jgi:hypothetical protein
MYRRKDQQAHSEEPSQLHHKTSEPNSRDVSKMQLSLEKKLKSPNEQSFEANLKRIFFSHHNL